MKIIPPQKADEEMEMSEPRIPRTLIPGRGMETDSVVQTELSAVLSMPSTNQNFEGLPNLNSALPPDTNGDVGPNHYVEWVNSSFAMFDKTGNIVLGPANGNTLWQTAPITDPCRTSNDGDPIVQYDHLADRWLLTQFALPNFPSGPFFQCIAVSATNDPTGSYHLYTFQVSPNKLNDYPHFGVWPDGYYMTVNQFDANQGLSFAGTGFYVFDRAKLLAGDPSATFQVFEQPGFGGILPADLDGPVPPSGSPNFLATFDDDAFSSGPDAIQIWKFHVDWTTPANSTLTGPVVINAAPLDSLICNASRGQCIPQKSTSVKLESISDRLMYRLQYRNFGTHEALVLSHTVDAGSGRAGLRWYEVRDPGGSPSIFQQGTFAPADGLHRWMGSVAMDKAGNLAAGYSVSNASSFPSIRYTGRQVTDPAGTLPQGEVVMKEGGGSQTSASARWGDYSMMAVDSTDDCTFWYAQEYLASTSNASWRTRIGSFRFPGCGAPPQGELQFSDPIYSVNENGTSIVITVTRAFGSTGPVSVQYSATNGSATEGDDFGATSGTVNFAAGDTTPQTFNIPIQNDSDTEGDETIQLALSNAGGGAILGSPLNAVVIIHDDDALFFDNFDDQDISDWTPTKGTWGAASESMDGTVDKKGDNISQAFNPGCTANCTFEADLQVVTASTRISLLGWYQDKKTLVELLLMDDKDMIQFKQRFQGSTKVKAKIPFMISVGSTIHVKITFSAGQFQVFLNGSGTPILTALTSTAPAGGIGFRIKSTSALPGTGKFENVLVY